MGTGDAGTATMEGQHEIDAARAAAWRERGWWGGPTQLDRFLERVASHPDDVAVVSYRQGLAEPERHTYGEIERASRRVAAALIDLGIDRGDVVSVQLPNRWEFSALVFGILRAGAIVNPLVPIFRRRELSFILARTESRMLVVPDRFRGFDHATMGVELAAELATLTHVVVVGGGDGGGTGADGALEVGTLLADTGRDDDETLTAELERRRPAGADIMQVQFTSGTTGEPKGVIHSHETLASGSRALDEVYGLGADDVAFMASTLAHQTGFCYGLLQPLALGMTVVYQDLWDASAALDIFERERVVWTVSATTFVMDLIAAQEAGPPRDLSRFRLFICGGAPIPPHVVHQTAEVLGAQLVAVWGMTENLVVTTTRPGDPPELVADSDGTPVDWMEVRIVDDDGNAVGVDGVGQLHVRGPNQALGYFKRPDLYEAASPGDDWFDSGDIARLRADGGIRIVGRTKDLVIRGGENIPVAEIENVLYTHPAVVEVAVVATPHPRLGEQACAVIVAKEEPPTLRQLTEFLEGAGMAKQFWPERLHVVDAMPKTPSGKIQKFHLREQVTAEI